MTARKQSISCSVRVHCLVSLIKHRKGVSERDPPWSEMLIQPISFFEIFPGEVVLLDQEVV